MCLKHTVQIPVYSNTHQILVYEPPTQTPNPLHTPTPPTQNELKDHDPREDTGGKKAGGKKAAGSKVTDSSGGAAGAGTAAGAKRKSLSGGSAGVDAKRAKKATA